MLGRQSSKMPLLVSYYYDIVNIAQFPYGGLANVHLFAGRFTEAANAASPAARANRGVATGGAPRMAGAPRAPNRELSEEELSVIIRPLTHAASASCVLRDAPFRRSSA